MKPLIVLAAAMIFLCSPVTAKRNDKSGNTEQAIMRIEKEMLDAVLKGDPSAAERYYADTYVFTGPNGVFQTKAEAIGDVKSGDLKLQGATLDDTKVSVYGDTAIVTYSSQDKGTYKGKDISGKTRWTDVFVKRRGQWQLVSSHGSNVSEK
jgi:ketosteroid isomerase-like protein